MRFELICQLHEQNAHWPVKLLCRVLGVSRSGYALFLKRQHQPEARQPSSRPGSCYHSDAVLLLHIRGAYRRGRCYSGSPRVHDDLREHGIHTSRMNVPR